MNAAEDEPAGTETFAGTGKFALLELVTATDAAEGALCESVMVQVVVAVAFAAMTEGAQLSDEIVTVGGFTVRDAAKEVPP